MNNFSSLWAVILTCLLLLKKSSSFTPSHALIKRTSHARVRSSINNDNNIPIPTNSETIAKVDVSSSSSAPSHKLYGNNYQTNKDHERLTRTTSKMIGPTFGGPLIGELPASIIRKFPLIMRAWSSRCALPHSNAAHVVDKLLHRLIEEREHGNENVKNEGVLCTSVFNLVIESWKKRSGKRFQYDKEEEEDEDSDPSEGSDDSPARRATNILEIMEELANSEKDKDMGPDAKSYWMVLKAWVASRDPDAIHEMKKILDRMEAAYQSGNEGLRPSVQCYNLYLYVLANRKSKNPKIDAEKANEIFQKLKTRNDHDIDMSPDINSYNQVISVYAKVRSFNSAMQAHAIFDDLIDNSNTTGVFPNTDTFNALMNCFLKSGPKRGRHYVERLLQTMVDLSDWNQYASASPDRFSINTVIAAVAKSYRKDSVRRAAFLLSNMESDFGVSPDSTSYNLVLDAYAKSRDLQGGKKAKNLLKEMEELYLGGNSDVQPDSVSYSTVIDAVSTRNDSGMASEEILSRMENLYQFHGGVKPGTVVYNSVMNAYSTQGDDESVRRTREILSNMEGRENYGVRPNIVSYNTVLKAYSYAREDYTQEAEDLLCRLERMSKEGDSGLLPDVISYTSVISCYARSDFPCKAKNALRILHQMIDAYKDGNRRAKPTVFTFNACLNACAFTFEQKEKLDAFIVAVSTLVLLQEHTRPDHTTYGTLLKAWCNLIPTNDERRPKIVKSVFQQCCKDGMVGPMVIQQLKYAATPELYLSLVGKDIKEEIKIASLPSQWSRNVNERNGKASLRNQRS